MGEADSQSGIDIAAVVAAWAAGIGGGTLNLVPTVVAEECVQAAEGAEWVHDSFHSPAWQSLLLAQPFLLYCPQPQVQRSSVKQASQQYSAFGLVQQRAEFAAPAGFSEPGDAVLGAVASAAS